MYNTEPYLDECIRSDLDQTYPHTEIIAAGDDSTASSAEILNGYSDCIHVHSKSDGGTASAPSLGARRMPGGLSMRPAADGAPRPHAAAAQAAPAARRLGDAAAAARIFYT